MLIDTACKALRAARLRERRYDGFSRHLEGDSYVYGGSYFDGASGWRDSPMRWGI